MPFEKFIPPRKQKPPQVSVKKTGTISLDTPLVKEFGLDRVDHVVLYFDPAKKLIGIKPADNAKDKAAIKLTHRTRVSSVRARSFFDNYGIKLEKTSRYSAEFDEQNGMVIVALPDVKRRRGPRKKRV